MIVRTAAAMLPSLYRRGLFPLWAKDNTPDPINARSKAGAGNAMFRKAIRQRRCLMPADGLYKWLKDQNGKTRIRFTLNNGGAFAFAGLHECGPPNAEGYREASVCMLTTPTNSRVAPVFEPYPVEAVRAYDVSRLMNRPPNERPEFIKPVA